MKDRVEFKEFWNKLEDIPINGKEEIEEPIGIFPIGTDRSDIWHWIEERFDFSLGKYLVEGRN